MKFSGVMIGAEDPDALGVFYTKLLGEPGFRDGTWYGWEGAGQLMLGAHSDIHGTSAQPQRLMLMIESEDVAASFTEIVAFGAGVVAEPYQPDGAPGDVWLATISDPEGNYVQLASPWE
jgi:predicted enzyme related to lactoylglutathione lyase